MIIAIHQPNYFPWLGYFAKMAQADAFVLLDDVQFSKGSYTNRVQIARKGAPAWLTVPVRHATGAVISSVETAGDDWNRVHRESLQQAYRDAEHFKAVWPAIEEMLAATRGTLAVVNAALIDEVARGLGLATRISKSSEYAIAAEQADERLARIVASMSPGGTYLSGGGGAKYQSDAVFSAHGIRLAYSTFKPAPYLRSGEPFIPGLSILDALFHLGWEKTAGIVRQDGQSRQ